jgi:hypothetical protein
MGDEDKPRVDGVDGPRMSPGQAVVAAPAVTAEEERIAANVVERAPGVPDNLTLMGAYISNNQLVYMFLARERGTWYECNYTMGTWHKYQLE